jgi:hypothetical protein
VLSEIRAVLESIAAKRCLLTTPSLLSSGTQLFARELTKLSKPAAALPSDP